jgi:hypothetical protein
MTTGIGVLPTGIVAASQPQSSALGRHTIKGLGGKILTVMVASERAKIAPPEYAAVSRAAVTATTAAFRVGLSAPLSFDCRFLAVHKASTGLR